MLKTRRRKGLGDQIAVSKYLDDEFVVSCVSCIVRVRGVDNLYFILACVVCVWTCRLARVDVADVVELLYICVVMRVFECLNV